MNLYAVTGRIPCDEEFTTRLVAAEDDLEAESKFVHAISAGRLTTRREIDAMVKQYGVSCDLAASQLIGELRETTVLLAADVLMDIL